MVSKHFPLFLPLSDAESLWPQAHDPVFIPFSIGRKQNASLERKKYEKSENQGNELRRNAPHLRNREQFHHLALAHRSCIAHARLTSVQKRKDRSHVFTTDCVFPLVPIIDQKHQRITSEGPH